MTKRDSEIPLPPRSPTRPLSPKLNGPFSEHFPINTISSSSSDVGSTGRWIAARQRWRMTVGDEDEITFKLKFSWLSTKKPRVCKPKHIRNNLFLVNSKNVKVEQPCKNKNHIGLMSHIIPQIKHSGRCNMRVKSYYTIPLRQSGAESSSFESMLNMCLS